MRMHFSRSISDPVTRSIPEPSNSVLTRLADPEVRSYLAELERLGLQPVK
jgi:hypothetical protein